MQCVRVPIVQVAFCWRVLVGTLPQSPPHLLPKENAAQRTVLAFLRTASITVAKCVWPSL